MTRQRSTTPLKQYGKQIQIVVISCLVALYIAVNLFHIGGDEFVISLNNNIVNPFALGVAIVAAMLWQKIPLGNQSRSLWAGLALGWALWAIAEFWWGIAAMIGQEVLYPSWADFFWLAGYLPMYFALWARIRTLPSNLNPTQKAGTWSSVLIVTVSTVFFVLMPILQANDRTLILESTLNILYPLADLALLVLVLRIFFSYQQGKYGRAWIWLSIGFTLHSLSNLFFSYISAVNLYYPDGQINLISTLAVDIPYNLSYVLWLAGLLALRNLQNIYTPFSADKSVLTPVPNTHIIVSTNRENAIIDVSQNYSRVFHLDAIKGRSTSEALGISDHEADKICAEIKTKMILQERSIIINNRTGTQEAWLSGIAVVNPQNAYSGSIFLLRLLAQDNALDEMLSAEKKSMVVFLLGKTGVKEKVEDEIQHLISGYYLAYIKALYNCILVEGGVIMADALLTELQSVAQQHGWQAIAHPQTFLNVTTPSASESKKAFSILLDTTKQFVANVIDEQTANTVVQNTSSTIDRSIHENLQRYEIAI